VPVPPELVATEPDSSDPNSMEEGAFATSRKLKYASCFSFCCLSVDHHASFLFQISSFFTPFFTHLYVVWFLSVHPEPIFGSSQNLKALVREASSRNLLDDGDAVLRLPLSQWHTSTCIHLAGFFQLHKHNPKIPWSWWLIFTKFGGEQILYINH